MEAEQKSLKVAYSSMNEQIQGIVLQLGSTDKLLQTTYNQVGILKQETLEVKTTQDDLKDEFLTAKEEI